MSEARREVCNYCQNTGWQVYYKNCWKFKRLCPKCRGIATTTEGDT